jgi:hypothetical protein
MSIYIYYSTIYILSVFRHFREESDPVCAGVHLALPGRVHVVHLRVQLRDEDLLRLLRGVNRVPHAVQVQGHLRQQPRYFPRGVPHRPGRRPGLLGQPRVRSHGGRY